MEWYQKAAKNGYAKSENNIAYLYQHGLGVDIDYKKAMEWYLKSASKNDAGAMYNIGYLYEKGLGVPVDIEKAKEWYDKAYSLGLDIARFRLNLLKIKTQNKHDS
ncbi:tetratricopeptide repeat protein [Providencia rettgeri]|nr:tetratricopeptide repeat protein [Providencia rettgeri]